MIDLHGNSVAVEKTDRRRFDEEEQETQLVFANGFVKAVNEAMDDIKNRSYFIGFRLYEANRYKYYEALGYGSIEELAEAEFGFKRSTTYGLMQAFNYAKSETPLYIADKYRGYSYTALLEMSKAKSVKYLNKSQGIETILTPKVSVSKIKEVRPLWDKYITEHDALPNCKSVDEFLELVKEQEAPAPLLELAAETETIEPQTADENGVQSIGLEEAADEDEAFEAELDEEQSAEELEELSDSLIIDEAIKCWGGRQYGKFEIYEKLKEQPLKSEFVSFIKNIYGTGGHGGAGCKFLSVDSSLSKGWTITRLSGRKIELPWTYVAGRISRLNELCKYFTPEEFANYTQWKAEQDGLIVNVAKPVEAEPEKPQCLNLKNDKARREWLDNFRNWGVWLEVPQVDKTFYRFDFANGAVLIIEVGFEYWSFSTKPGAQERISYSIIDNEHPKFNSQGESYTSVLQWLTKHGKEV